MKPSPFTNAAKPAPAPVSVAPEVIGIQPTAMLAVRPSSPLAKVQRRPSLEETVISNEDIEGLGSDLSRGVSQTTDKVIQKMTVNRFGELGEILANVELEVGKLNADNRDKGVIGWFQAKFTDVRKTLMMHFDSAQQAFNQLETKMTQQIAVHQEWIKDFDSLYSENYDHYLKVVDTIRSSEGWELALAQQLQNWPVIDPADPDGPMKMQAKTEAESRLNRLRIKIDMFRRLKVITENNGPKIRAQQETSRTVIQTLNDTIVQAIPLIKMEFAMYLQSLDAMKSLGTVDQTRQLANTSLQKSAESAKGAALSSAKTLNTAMLSNDTLNVIRSKMLETLTGVQQIQAQAQQQRIEDARSMADSQAQYLTQLQQKGAV